MIVRDVFHLPHWFRQIENLDYQVPADIQLTLMDELMRLGRRATRWFLRSRRNELDAARDVAHFGPRIAALGLKLNELLEGADPRAVAGALPDLRRRRRAGTAGTHGGRSSHLYTLLPIIEASDVTGQDTAEVAKAYFAVGSALDLTWYLQQITNLPVENNWQALAREAFRDDLDW
ncbi:NAD-glutamate dehydrogenase, partial [Pseudomonas aeruginosa]